jgi:hypothetical protein
MRRLFLIIFLLCLASNAGATSLSNAVTVFGTGADGAFTAVNPITALTPTSWNLPIIKNYTSFTLGAGKAISPTARNMGIYIYVNGTATISGNITQTNMCYPSHGYGEGSTLYNLANKGLISPVTGTAYWRKVRGGNGGTGGYAYASAYGAGGSGETGNVIGGGFGGGGSSAALSDSGTAFSIGRSGGAAVLGSYGAGGSNQNSFTFPAMCTTAGGNIGSGGDGGKKAGGAIWIIAKKIIINPTAKFYVNASQAGSAGGVTTSNCTVNNAGGGGGGGGGYVALAYNTISDSGISYTTAPVTASTPTFYTMGATGGAAGTKAGGGGSAGQAGYSGGKGHAYKIDLTNKTFNEYIQ